MYITIKLVTFIRIKKWESIREDQGGVEDPTQPPEVCVLGGERDQACGDHSELTAEEENRLVKVLKGHMEAIGWHILDLKGISPANYMHKKMMEGDYRPIIQP